MSATGKKGVKRKAHTIEFKYQAILEVERGRSQVAVAKSLDISASTVATWYSKKDAIKQGYMDFGPKQKSLKTGKWEELETALLKWFSSARDQGAIVSGAVLLEKANQYAESLGITDFEAKPGWLTRFKDRNNIAFKSVCGESKEVDTETDAVKQWQTKLAVLLKQYETDCVYNADETGLFFKMLPSKTMEFKNVDCHGGKRSKERLTVLVGANMIGNDKLPLFVIGKSAKPRCFKNVQTLPTKYTSNKKAWMTGDIFTEWLKALDRLMSRRQRKIALIIDNCPAHPNVHLQNIELVFLPPNTTSKLQPMDQGIINNLKVLYRKQVVMRQIRAIESKTDFSVSVLDALRFLKSAWDQVSVRTIANCFRHAGFEQDVAPTNSSSCDDDDELDDIPLSQLARLGDSRSLEAFVNFRESPATSTTATDEDIIAETIDARSSQKEVDEESDTDDEPRPSRSIDDALNALDVLQEFWETQNNSDQQLGAVINMHRAIMKKKLRDMCSRKQASILAFTTTCNTSQILTESDECRLST